MSVYAPNSDITLISAPLTYGDANQIDFATLSAQSTYFNGLAASGAVYSDCTYQRKDGYIRVPALAENLYNYNYCFYTNFNGKRIYAFITKIEFVNQNCTNVYIKTDVFQTWLFDFTFKQCLVVREHTTTDVPYEHTLPEPIDAGDAREICRYKATPYSLSAKTDTEFDTNYRVVFCLSEAWGTDLHDVLDLEGSCGGMLFEKPIESIFDYVNAIKSGEGFMPIIPDVRKELTSDAVNTLPMTLFDAGCPRRSGCL